MKILQGLAVPDGVEHVVTVGSGPGGSTALEREGPKPRAARTIVASRDGGVELPRRTVRPPLTSEERRGALAVVIRRAQPAGVVADSVAETGGPLRRGARGDDEVMTDSPASRNTVECRA